MLGGQMADARPSKTTPAHVVQRCFADGIISVTGVQHNWEVQIALLRSMPESK